MIFSKRESLIAGAKFISNPFFNQKDQAPEQQPEHPNFLRRRGTSFHHGPAQSLPWTVVGDKDFW
jgi:hypothetical protein